jgi:hypothetical protein
MLNAVLSLPAVAGECFRSLDAFAISPSIVYCRRLKTSRIDGKKTCMAKCGTISKQQDDAPLFYSLKTLCSRSAPKNLRELNAWLTEEGKHPDWDGKLYVASTIRWNPAANEFQQTGCSPNYHAG